MATVYNREDYDFSEDEDGMGYPILRECHINLAHLATDQSLCKVVESCSKMWMGQKSLGSVDFSHV